MAKSVKKIAYISISIITKFIINKNGESKNTRAAYVPILLLPIAWTIIFLIKMDENIAKSKASNFKIKTVGIMLKLNFIKARK